MCERIASILQEVFPSPEMSSYLAERVLTKMNLRNPFFPRKRAWSHISPGNTSLHTSGNIGGTWRTLKNDYDYTVFGTEVRYVSHNNSSRWDWPGFSTDCDLNLPVPFHAGDIVTIDCRPSAPVRHAVILEVGDNRDCCCLQALYRNDDGTWDTGAVKHGNVLPNHYSPDISPLYRLASFRGQLPEEDRLLEKLGRYVGRDEERGADLWNYVAFCGDRRRRTVSETQILSYVEHHGIP